MTKQIQVFKNKDLNLSARALQNEDGNISISLEDSGKGLGFIKIDRKNGKQYTRLDMPRIQKYIIEVGFGKEFPNVSKDDFIPESLFYLLAMKANNKVAQEFQKWLAVEVIPSIRKTGGYTNTKSKVDNSLKEKEIEARLKNARAREANILLKICNNPNLSKEYVQVLQSKAAEMVTGQLILPLPEVERKTYSATELGKMLGISANKVGSLANKHNLKTEEYGKLYHDKSKYSNKEVESFRYYDNVIPVLEELI